MDANMQFTINHFRQLFPDKIFSLIFSKIPDSCQIPSHFQVFQTSGHPVISICICYTETIPGTYILTRHLVVTG